MKEIKFSDHALLKIEILRNHGIIIDKDFVKEGFSNLEKIEQGYRSRLILQRELDQEHVLRIVYEEFVDHILIITLYPARRKRYEKNSI